MGQRSPIIRLGRWASVGCTSPREAVRCDVCVRSATASPRSRGGLDPLPRTPPMIGHRSPRSVGIAPAAPAGARSDRRARPACGPTSRPGDRAGHERRRRTCPPRPPPRRGRRRAAPQGADRRPPVARRVPVGRRRRAARRGPLGRGGGTARARRRLRRDHAPPTAARLAAALAAAGAHVRRGGRRPHWPSRRHGSGRSPKTCGPPPRGNQPDDALAADLLAHVHVGRAAPSPGRPAARSSACRRRSAASTSGPPTSKR